MPQTAQVALEVLPGELSIHRFPADTQLTTLLTALAPAGDAAASALFATLQSDEELSVVCDATLSVAAEQSSGPWRAFRVQGELDFALTGILAGLAAPLAAASISIFAISSYNTDYVLVPAETLGAALRTLRDAGFNIAYPADLT